MPDQRMNVLALLVGVLLLGSGPASAAESYDSCSGFIDSVPAVIGTQGTWCLRSDRATSIAAGTAISVATNNVTIDCNGFKLGGLAAGPATTASGIYASNRLNVTIRNCNIRGFESGVLIFGGGGHVVEDNRFDGNTVLGVAISDADNVTIRRNEIFDTGGSPTNVTASGILLQDSTSCTITDNTVAGVSPLAGAAPGSFPAGMLVGCAAVEVRSNRVYGLDPEGNGTAGGIRSYGVGTRIVDNFVHGSHNILAGVGIAGEGQLTLCHRNVVTGMQAGITLCAQADNHVLPLSGP